VVGSGRIDETRRLLAVDSLVEVTVKEDVLHVKLVNRPGSGSGNAENSPDGRRFDHRTKRLIVVYAVLLGETANNPARLVTSETAVRVELVFEDPLAGDNVGAGWMRYKALGAVVDQRLVPIGHGGTPIWISQTTAVVAGNR
jgi:hypothetical protein